MILTNLLSEWLFSPIFTLKFIFLLAYIPNNDVVDPVITLTVRAYDLGIPSL